MIWAIIFTDFHHLLWRRSEKNGCWFFSVQRASSGRARRRDDEHHRQSVNRLPSPDAWDSCLNLRRQSPAATAGGLLPPSQCSNHITLGFPLDSILNASCTCLTSQFHLPDPANVRCSDSGNGAQRVVRGPTQYLPTSGALSKNALAAPSPR